MSSGETSNQPGSNGIEERSKIQELEEREAKRSRSSLKDSTAPAELKDDPPNILEFPASALECSGLHYDEKEKLVLYRREAFEELDTFLDGVLHTRRRSVGKAFNPYQLGWILGPPGVGKSAAVFAFTRSPRVSEWAVTWIHCLQAGKRFSSRHRDKTEEKTNVLRSDEYRKYLAELKVGNQQHLLVLDGYANDTDGTMLADSYAWLEANFEKRRVVVVCSLASRGKSNKADDLNLGVEQFTVCSWTLEDYIAAVKEPELYEAVKEKLGEAADKSTDELIESKYYFAGGSVCYMFQMTADQVKEDLETAIASVRNMQTFEAGVTGWLSTSFVHCLVSIHRQTQGTVIRGIVSQYAGNQLADSLGTQVVDYFTNLYRSKLSPPMKGSLFEMWFFAKLSREGLNYDLIGGGPGKTWPKSDPVNMPSKNEELFRKSSTWFQPAWNNGGFDAVYVDPHTNTVRFVQITPNSHHSFKIHFFKNFLDRLTTYMPIVTLEIFFVYSKGSDSPNTPVTTGEGLLVPFNWTKGKEWDKVTKVTLEWHGKYF